MTIKSAPLWIWPLLIAGIFAAMLFERWQRPWDCTECRTDAFEGQEWRCGVYPKKVLGALE